MIEVNIILALFLLAIIILITLSLILYNRRKTRKILDHVNKMLDLAISGDFEERIFDESMLSQVETRLAHYLASSEVSKKNLGQEKKKIKELISDISHQTKTPIANIMLYTQLLGEQKLTEESRDYVNLLSEQTDKLNFLVGSLVKTSRLETGIVEVHPALRPIGPMLQSVLMQVRPKAEKKSILLTLETEDEITAYFDPKWTEEAVYNILDNAVKYSPPKGKIEIRVKSYELFASIRVRDEGIGIMEEEQAKIFGRFYRSSRVADQEGVGIGLYLAREIISSQGGYIKVSSKLGSGATFSICLPKSNH